jgi:hypothetical protein
MKIRNLAILGGLMIAAGMATVACSGDDDDTSTATDAGKDGSTTLDSGVKSDSSTGDAASGDAGTIPNHAAVLGFVQSVVTDQIEHNGGAVLSYFVPNTVTGHSPSLTDIEDCLAYQFGAVIGNGDTYPPSLADGGAVDGGAPLADGYHCRADMSQIHQPLGIPGDIFDQFVGDITTEAMLKGVTFTSQQSGEILGLKQYIVDPNAPDGASYGWEDAGASDAAADAADSGG